MSTKDPYIKMLLEATSVNKGGVVVKKQLNENKQLLLEDNLITWFKARGLNIEQVGGSANPFTIFLFVSGFAVTALIDIAHASSRKGIDPVFVLNQIAKLLLAVLANHKLVSDAKEILNTPFKERVENYAPNRIIGAHALMMFMEMNKIIAVGQGVDYLRRLKIILSNLEKLEKQAKEYKAASSGYKKDEWDNIITRIENKIDEIKTDIRREA